MAFYDWFCPDCDAERRDVQMSMASVPRYIACPCGGQMEQDFSRKRTQNYTQDNAGLYGRYEPAYGCVVRDYEHKRALLKQYDAIEASDPVKGSRWYDTPGYDPESKTYTSDFVKGQEAAAASAAQVGWGASVTEAIGSAVSKADGDTQRAVKAGNAIVDNVTVGSVGDE